LIHAWHINASKLEMTCFTTKTNWGEKHKTKIHPLPT